MASRTWYEVRVRECVVPGRNIKGRWIEGRYVKKSKFYFTKGPGDAAKKYKGKGFIMWVQKVSQEKLLGVGEFFTLGNSLLRELQRGGGSLEEELAGNRQNRKRGYYGKSKQKATY